jgi:PadR family transcriptional regulator PadR
MKKGVLDLCVLSILSNEDCYGYQLVEIVSRVVEISEGTIYPLLKRLQKEKLLSSYIVESSEGPARKYYRLTDFGKTKFVSLKEDWTDFVGRVNSLMSEVNGSQIPHG